VERWNGFVGAGVDEDFHRGEDEFDTYFAFGSALTPIDQPPYVAARLVLGDLGTKGGLLTDADANVLRPDGSPIPGLYAAGNVSSAVMGHTYPGPGGTIGPALVFGYLAAEHIAQVSTGSTTGSGSTTDREAS
jgi:3-oxosteroid 1-dehydrogenase